MTGGPMTGATILIVDDEPISRMLMKSLLEPHGHRILEAEHGAQALEIAEREAIDVVLLDVNMPGIDGLEVCRRLRERPKTAHLPIVILAAPDDRETRINALKAGCDDFLSKPVDDLEMPARVRNLVMVKRYRESLAI